MFFQIDFLHGGMTIELSNYFMYIRIDKKSKLLCNNAKLISCLQLQLNHQGFSCHIKDAKFQNNSPSENNLKKSEVTHLSNCYALADWYARLLAKMALRWNAIHQKWPISTTGAFAFRISRYTLKSVSMIFINEWPIAQK